MSETKLKPCPVCGRYPKIKRDYGYEQSGFGAWCTIQCKPFLRKPHLKVEEGKRDVRNARSMERLWNVRKVPPAELLQDNVFCTSEADELLDSNEAVRGDVWQGFRRFLDRRGKM